MLLFCFETALIILKYPTFTSPKTISPNLPLKLWNTRVTGKNNRMYVQLTKNHICVYFCKLRGGWMWMRETYSAENYTAGGYLSTGLALQELSRETRTHSWFYVSTCWQWNSIPVMEKQLVHVAWSSCKIINMATAQKNFKENIKRHSILLLRDKSHESDIVVCPCSCLLWSRNCHYLRRDPAIPKSE